MEADMCLFLAFWPKSSPEIHAADDVTRSDPVSKVVNVNKLQNHLSVPICVPTLSVMIPTYILC